MLRSNMESTLLTSSVLAGWKLYSACTIFGWELASFILTVLSHYLSTIFKLNWHKTGHKSHVIVQQSKKILSNSSVSANIEIYKNRNY